MRIGAVWKACIGFTEWLIKILTSISLINKRHICNVFKCISHGHSQYSLEIPKYLNICFEIFIDIFDLSSAQACRIRSVKRIANVCVDVLVLHAKCNAVKGLNVRIGEVWN